MLSDDAERMASGIAADVMYTGSSDSELDTEDEVEAVRRVRTSCTRTRSRLFIGYVHRALVQGLGCAQDKFIVYSYKSGQLA